MRNKIKKLISLLVKTGITIGVMWWIISKFGWEKITSTIAGADPLWIAIGTIVFVISVFLGALQWRVLLLNRGLDLPIGKTISLYFTGIFFNNFMLGMVAGDSYKVAHLHFSEGKAKSGFAATFYDRIAGLLVVSLFALVGGLCLFFTSRGESGHAVQDIVPISVPFTAIHVNVTPEMWINGTLIFTLLFALFLVGFFVLFLSKRLQSWCLAVTGIIRDEKLRNRTRSILQEMFIDRHDAAEKRAFGVVLLYSLVIQLLRMAVHVAAAISLGIFQLATLHYFFIIIPIVSIITIVPLPLGIKEALGGTLFLAAGYHHDEAVVMEFLAWIMVVIGSISGGISFILDKKKHTA